MSQTDVYADADAGSDANLGTSWSDAIKTPKAVADRCNALGQGVVTDIYWRGVFDIGHNAGNDPALALFKPTVSFTSGLRHHLSVGTYFVYGTWYDPSDIAMTNDSYGTVAHAIPSGLSIECVMLDWEMSNASHVLSDGRRETDLATAADAAACQATSYSYFQTGSTLHINRGAVPGGSIIVVYRPTASVLMHQVTASSVRYLGAGKTVCGVVMPRYVTAAINSYFCQLNPNGVTGAGPYLMSGMKCEYCWHLFGLISNIGTTAYDGFRIEDCEVSVSVVSDYSGTSANPFVAYSSITTGTLANTNYTSGRNVFRHQRPVKYGGTTVAAGTGGTAGNNVVQVFYAHTGAGGSVSIVNTGPGSDQDTHLIWDYEITDPYPMERNNQTHTDTPHTDSAWASYARDMTVRSMLSIANSPDDSRYGLMTISANCHFRWKRGVWMWPDLKVVNGSSGGEFVFPVVSSNAGDVICEMEYVKIMTRGLSRAVYRRAFALWNNGGAGTPNIKLRRKNVTFVSMAATLSQSIVDIHCEGTMLGFVEDNDCLFHSNDTVNTLYFVKIYVASTTQIPLYSTTPANLKQSNNFYSNYGANRYDVSGGGQRDTDAEWQTGADGPHDSKISQASGVKDARYESAGTFDSTTESFGAGDTARTTKIAASVTRNYTAGSGANGRIDDRRFGADQFGGSSVGMLMAIGVFDAA